MSITGRRDDEAGAGPQKAGVAVTDILTGLYATIGVLAALAHRERSGVGQHIDLGLLDVQVACLANQAMNFLVSGTAPRRSGNAHPNLVPYQDFPTSDGYMVIAVGTDALLVGIEVRIALESRESCDGATMGELRRRCRLRSPCSRRLVGKSWYGTRLGARCRSAVGCRR